MQQKPVFQEPLFRCIVLGGGILLIFAAFLMHFQAALHAAGTLLHTLRPLLLGVLFATMLEPSFQRLQSDFTRFAQKHRAPTGWIQPVSLAGAILPPVLVLVSIVCVLIPQTTASVRMLTGNFQLYTENFMRRISAFADTPVARLLPPEKLETLFAALQDKLPALLLKTYDCTAALIGVLLDLVIGTVFALYLLAGEKDMQAYLQMHAGNESSRRMLRCGRSVCGTFARFVNSQCREALILGVLCFCGMLLFRFPYPLLISSVIAVTNIVPYIGPFAGTVPCALLLLFVKPEAVLWFLLFIIVIQQIESNFIFPRVVGHSVGLPPAWVLAAVVLGGGLFGITGMLLAVPVIAAFYALLIPQKSRS